MIFFESNLIASDSIFVIFQGLLLWGFVDPRLILPLR